MEGEEIRMMVLLFGRLDKVDSVHARHWFPSLKKFFYQGNALISDISHLARLRHYFDRNSIHY
jgi:hypothetical protein